jgi:protocatechuate 3,4-dioxygenase beta subunit
MNCRLGIPALVALMTSLVALPADTQQQTPWKGTLAGPGERGERMVVSGRVLDKATGKPIANAEVYVYQADEKGIYGESPRTPRMKATIYTRSDGYFEYSTIRPASYAEEKNPKIMLPAHVHYVVYADGYREWQGELVFEDDPLITPEKRAEMEKDPYFILRPIAKDAKGVWQVVADVALVK